MKKKLIITAMAVCLVIGSTQVGLGATCNAGSNLAGIMEKLQQCIMERFNVQISLLPGYEKTDTDTSEAEKPDTDTSETEKPDTETPDQTKPEQGEQETEKEQITTQSSQTAQVVALTNQERNSQGLSSLKSNSELNKLAQMKAEDMANNNYFSHTSPTYGSAFDMMNTYGVSYRTAGENIAKGQKTAEAVMTGWMNSSGHRANILNSSYTEIGVGYAKDSNGTTYWVQIFKG